MALTSSKTAAQFCFQNLRVGFWNIQKKNNLEIGSYVSDLLVSKDLDLLLLSEFENFDPTPCLVGKYIIIDSGPNCKKVMAISKVGLDFCVATDDRRYVLLKSYKYGCSLVGLHLRDNVHGDSNDLDRHDVLQNILEDLVSAKMDHHILLGDFNCLPTDWEMIDSKGLHAVLFKEELNIDSGETPKHYNPILLSLNENGPNYGSFRYVNDRCRLYWYAYDQVVVSRSLSDSISGIEYLRSINGRSLMSSQGISPSVSDHLPLIFVIKESENGQ